MKLAEQKPPINSERRSLNDPGVFARASLSETSFSPRARIVVGGSQLAGDLTTHAKALDQAGLPKAYALRLSENLGSSVLHRVPLKNDGDPIQALGPYSRLDVGAREHGCSLTINDLTSGLDKAEIIHGFPKQLASNYGAVKVLYINGMAKDPNELSKDISELADAKGALVTGIVNRKRPCPMQSVFNSIAGIVSSRLGRWLEPNTTRNLERSILDAAATEQKVELVAHSQGVIILNNVLKGLKAKLGRKAWGKIAGQIQVTANGALIFGWPEGVKVEHRIHLLDPVPWLMGFASAIKNIFKSDRSNFNIRAGFGHHFSRYLKNDARFILNACRTEAGRVDGVKLAQKVYMQIRDGVISDERAESLLRLGYKEAGEQFARSFEQLSKNGRVDRFVVPNFRVPNASAQKVNVAIASQVHPAPHLELDRAAGLNPSSATGQRKVMPIGKSRSLAA